MKRFFKRNWRILWIFCIERVECGVLAWINLDGAVVLRRITPPLHPNSFMPKHQLRHYLGSVHIQIISWIKYHLIVSISVSAVPRRCLGTKPQTQMEWLCESEITSVCYFHQYLTFGNDRKCWLSRSMVPGALRPFWEVNHNIYITKSIGHKLAAYSRCQTTRFPLIETVNWQPVTESVACDIRVRYLKGSGYEYG